MTKPILVNDAAWPQPAGLWINQYTELKISAILGEGCRNVTEFN